MENMRACALHTTDMNRVHEHVTQNIPLNVKGGYFMNTKFFIRASELHLVFSDKLIRHPV